MERSLSFRQITTWFFIWLALTIDVMDWQLLSFAAPHIIKEMGFSLPQMGLLLGAPLLGAGISAVFAGWLADRFGRVRTMVACIIWYSVLTLQFPMCHSFYAMLVNRVLAGVGLGAQWGVGHTLSAEVLPDKYRMIASATIQTGYAFGPVIGAFLGKLIIPVYGWRHLFYTGAVAGMVLVLLAVVSVRESLIWLEARNRALKDGNFRLGRIKTLFEGELRPRLIATFALVFFTVLAYWSSISWIPSWLMSEKGLSVVKSMNYLLVLNAGAVLGFIIIGFMAGRWGRKPPIYGALILSSMAVLIFVNINDAKTLLEFAFVYGLITSPVYGLYGGYFSELFPTEVRASAVNGVWGVARIISFFGPYILGWIAAVSSMGMAIGTTALLYLLAAVPVLFLPETLVRRQGT
ncbi:MFS transporter [Desulfofundulus thermocisternus]|uniref:MFS transporter n=1 Tax=Desulfofundulus thermocisternus TaxID=42471 RepID=UPI0019E0DB35|nr:MFS transporter [Desulfofundulus thermocisternus]MBE3586030.1 MFS transporter [Thermoanaerobacter sp.]MCS5695048.1 MFS transporter [Desulfofundulus thermocisternus]